MKQYTKYLFEIVAIFIGISASFIVEDFRLKRIKKAELKFAFESIRSSLELDIEQLSENLERFDFRDEYIEKWFNDNYYPDSQDEAVNSYAAISDEVDFHPDLTGYSIFLETDGKELIESKSLRVAIGYYYNTTVPNLQMTRDRDREWSIGTALEILEEMEHFDPDQLYEHYRSHKKVVQSQFKNKLNLHKVMRRSYTGLTQSTLTEARDLKRMIDDLLEEGL